MMELSHFVWYPIPGEGYRKLPVASSDGFNPSVYIHLFAGEYVPIIYKTNENYAAYLLFNKPTLREIVFTKISLKKKMDEYGREGLYHHSAIIKREALENGTISLFDVEKAMDDFEKVYPRPRGNIPPLEVPQNESFNYMCLKKYLTQQAVEHIVSRFTKTGKNRTFLRCPGATEKERFEISVALLTLLNFVFKLQPISFSTETPLLGVHYKFFNLLVVERVIPPDRDADEWIVIRWDEQKEIQRKIPEDIKEKLSEIFS